jgi:hypothetical protein
MVECVSLAVFGVDTRMAKVVTRMNGNGGWGQRNAVLVGPYC